ncbi:MAG: PE domain-containing protein [Mycobacterium sp.]|nr:PE domain-containing protein [Mycobacterium sp.]
MSFVTTLPEALAAAAAQLQTLGSSMAAENAAAAAPTTAIAPAAADEVSALQATQFTAFGNLYQAVSAQAQAIHQMLVGTLGTNAGSYTATEAANQAATASTPFSGLFSAIFGQPAYTGGGLLSNNLSNIFNIGTGNWASASSDLLALAGGGLLPSVEGPTDVPAAGLGAGLGGGLLTSAAAPASSAGSAGLSAGLGGAPVLAGVGQASSVGALSVPPTWAGNAVPAATSTPAKLVGTGWTSAAPQGAPVNTVPAGMPAAASVGKSAGFGAPRYGVKPKVAPKPAVV